MIQLARLIWLGVERKYGSNTAKIINTKTPKFEPIRGNGYDIRIPRPRFTSKGYSTFLEHDKKKFVHLCYALVARVSSHGSQNSSKPIGTCRTMKRLHRLHSSTKFCYKNADMHFEVNRGRWFRKTWLFVSILSSNSISHVVQGREELWPLKWNFRWKIRKTKITGELERIDTNNPVLRNQRHRFAPKYISAFL